MSDYHDSPRCMARSLATYIDCPQRIQREVRAHFSSSPHISTIREYRAAFLRQKATAKRDASRPDDKAQKNDDRLYANRMEASSFALLERINNARGIAV